MKKKKELHKRGFSGDEDYEFSLWEFVIMAGIVVGTMMFLIYLLKIS